MDVQRTTGHWELPETAQCGYGGSRCTERGTLQIDPFEYDLNDRKILRYLCPNCAQEIADEL